MPVNSIIWINLERNERELVKNEEMESVPIEAKRPTDPPVSAPSPTVSTASVTTLELILNPENLESVLLLTGFLPDPLIMYSGLATVTSIVVCLTVSVKLNMISMNAF